MAVIYQIHRHLLHGTTRLAKYGEPDIINIEMEILLMQRKINGMRNRIA